MPQGFELVLLPPDVTSAEGQPAYGWLLQHLPAVPNFSHLRQAAIHGLRIACHVSQYPSSSLPTSILQLVFSIFLFATYDMNCRCRNVQMEFFFCYNVLILLF